MFDVLFFKLADPIPQDDILRVAVANTNEDWKKIAQYLPGKTEVQCLLRWTRVLNRRLPKAWTDEVHFAAINNRFSIEHSAV